MWLSLSLLGQHRVLPVEIFNKKKRERNEKRAGRLVGYSYTPLYGKKQQGTKGAITIFELYLCREKNYYFPLDKKRTDGYFIFSSISSSLFHLLSLPLHFISIRFMSHLVPACLLLCLPSFAFYLSLSMKPYLQLSVIFHFDEREAKRDS